MNSPPAFVKFACLPLLSAVLMWCAQPPYTLWPLCFFTLVPMIYLITNRWDFQLRHWFGIWLAGAGYWLLSLQGLRHAHPLMFLGWWALSAYLAVYWVIFIYSARWMIQKRSVPVGLAVATAWLGQEYLRNHLFTGISACMLGHSLAEVPVAIQVASLFGSYGVTALVVAINLLAFYGSKQILNRHRVQRRERLCKPDGNVHELNEDLKNHNSSPSEPSLPREDASWLDSTRLDLIFCIAWVTVVLAYGVWRLETAAGRQGESVGHFMLVQKSEPVEYTQPTERTIEIYQSYVQQTLESLEQYGKPVQVIVWPESMYSAGNPWMLFEPSDTRELQTITGLASTDLRAGVEESQAYFKQRSAMLANASQYAMGVDADLDFIVGSGVLRYTDRPEVYCGLVQFNASGEVEQWYGKNHLVMFGEYIPLVSSLPWVREWLPPGMGLHRGGLPIPMQAGNARVLPNICIETAVERVAVNHLRKLNDANQDIDVIVTVTNDGWFKQSSIIDHHLRCAQFVAVGTGRPVLSAANNGPTAWINAEGRVRERLATGGDGFVVATPKRAISSTAYVRWGDYPVFVLACITCIPLLTQCWRWTKRFRNEKKSSNEDS